MEGTSDSQKMEVQPVDAVSKNIQNEILNVQRKRQELSSKEDISVEDKQKKRQEMQQEISRLNAQLRQRQAEMRREKQRELLSEEMKKDSDKAKKVETKETEKAEKETKEGKGGGTEEEKKDTSGMGMEEAAAANIALQQLRSRRNVISGMENDITILEGEIRQDEARGANVEEKQAALKKQEEKVQNASASQFSVLDNSYKVIVDATRANADKAKGTTGIKSSKGADVLIKPTNYAKEKNQSPQPFYTSFTLYS
ncbi:MAG: FlxA-like family protein [Lachnospiraceae bacterium]|nr:FlxA-like family protein [Lachnospiraceae bacterium]